MRETLVITVDIEDNSEENSNWLVDLIALDNTITDCLEAGAILHSISIEPKDESPQQERGVDKISILEAMKKQLRLLHGIEITAKDDMLIACVFAYASSFNSGTIHARNDGARDAIDIVISDISEMEFPETDSNNTITRDSSLEKLRFIRKHL